MNKGRKWIVLLGLTMLICSLSASPFWLYQCPHQFSEAEKTYLMQQRVALIERNWSHIKDFDLSEHQDEIDEYRQRLDEAYIPCGVGNVSPEEKWEITNNYAGLFDGYLLPLPALRIDLDYIHLDRSTPKYYFQAYTFFYIPVFCIRSILPGRLLESYHPTCPVDLESVSP